ncbi:MAG: hypothetical protein ABFE01_23880 [Phycisphaerales bacterium]
MLDFGIPDPYPGTEAEKWANYQSHDWWRPGGEWECGRCSAKPWHVAAEWPCGQEPTRHPARIPDEG